MAEINTTYAGVYTEYQLRAEIETTYVGIYVELEYELDPPPVPSESKSSLPPRGLSLLI